MSINWSSKVGREGGKLLRSGQRTSSCSKCEADARVKHWQWNTVLHLNRLQHCSRYCIHTELSRLKTGQRRPWQETGSGSAPWDSPTAQAMVSVITLHGSHFKSNTKSNQPTANHTTEKHHISQKLRHSFEDRLHLVRIGMDPLNQKCEADSSGFVLCTAQGWFSINTQQVCTIEFQCRNQEY